MTFYSVALSGSNSFKPNVAFENPATNNPLMMMKNSFGLDFNKVCTASVSATTQATSLSTLSTILAAGDANGTTSANDTTPASTSDSNGTSTAPAPADNSTNATPAATSVNNCYSAPALSKVKIFSLVSMVVMVLVFLIAQFTKNNIRNVDINGINKGITCYWAVYFTYLLFFRFYMFSSSTTGQNPTGFPLPK